MKNKFFYDLHIHSCFSACASDDMTPANIAGFSRLEGLDWISVTDHNSADNLPAVAKACREYGVGFLPGIEVTSEEDIHLLCYFRELSAAIYMSECLHKALPAYPYDRSIFGNQLMMDEEDQVLAEGIRLFSAAVSMNIYEIKQLCESLGGLCVPAHVNRTANSLLSVMGTILEDFPCPAYEYSLLGQNFPAGKDTLFPCNSEVLYSSDAHTLTDIGACHAFLSEGSFFLAWMQGQC